MKRIMFMTLLGFTGLVWAAHYKYEGAVILFSLIFIGGCYAMLLVGYYL